jgi:hypothetical protein
VAPATAVQVQTAADPLAAETLQMLMIALTTKWSTPIAALRTASPLEVYRADRHRTMKFGLALGLPRALTSELPSGLPLEQAFRLAIGLALALALGLAIGRGPPLQLTVVEAIWGNS